MSKRLVFEPLQRIAFYGDSVPMFMTRNPFFFEKMDQRYLAEPAIRVFSISPWYLFNRLSTDRGVEGCHGEGIVLIEGIYAKTRLTLFYKDFSKFLVPVNTYQSGLSKFYSDHGMMPQLTEMWTLPETCGEIPW